MRLSHKVVVNEARNMRGTEMWSRAGFTETQEIRTEGSENNWQFNAEKLKLAQSG